MKITPDMIDYDDEAAIVTADGKRYRVTLENDLDTSPTDFENYDEDDIERWHNDEWYYMGVIVTPLDVPEFKQFELSDSLWGVEYYLRLDPPQTIDGHVYRYTNMDYMCMVHPVPEMIDVVISHVDTYQAAAAYESYVLS